VCSWVDYIDFVKLSKQYECILNLILYINHLYITLMPPKKNRKQKLSIASDDDL